jgi:hypothetical protein
MGCFQRLPPVPSLQPSHSNQRNPIGETCLEIARAFIGEELFISEEPPQQKVLCNWATFNASQAATREKLPAVHNKVALSTWGSAAFTASQTATCFFISALAVLRNSLQVSYNAQNFALVIQLSFESKMQPVFPLRPGPRNSCHWLFHVILDLEASTTK